MVEADLSRGDTFQQMWAHQVKVSDWSLVGGGRQPLATALVRALELEVREGDKMRPRGFRGRWARHED